MKLFKLIKKGDFEIQLGIALELENLDSKTIELANSKVGEGYSLVEEDYLEPEQHSIPLTPAERIAEALKDLSEDQVNTVISKLLEK